MAVIHKIAVIQLYAKPLDPENNFGRACNFIRSAASQGAQLAILPEYHLTNWLPGEAAFAACCQDWEKYLRGYRDLAKECNICIVPGTIVRKLSNDEPTKSGERTGQNQPPKMVHSKDGNSLVYITPSGQPAETGYLNTTYFISNTGEVLGEYTKKNLWGVGERSHLTSSGRDDHPVIDTPLGKVGLLICWDIAFPEAFRELIAQGAKLIIIPMFWTLSDASEIGMRYNPASEAVFVDSLAVSRAFENTCAVVVCNIAGKAGEASQSPQYLGHSQVTMPFVGEMSKLGRDEGMTVVDLNMQILEDAEDNYQVRTDLAHDDWHYDYRHTMDDKSQKVL